MREIVKPTVELLAGIPSVVLGFARRAKKPPFHVRHPATVVRVRPTCVVSVAHRPCTWTLYPDVKAVDLGPTILDPAG